MSGNVTGNKSAPLAERGHDLYETPAVAVHALMRVEKLPQVIWEPACGPGAIVQTLREAGHIVIAQDLVHYGCPDSRGGLDFLEETAAPAGCECIVTNPPYRRDLVGKFVANAVALVPRVYMLVRLAFLESEGRSDILDGGRLARIYPFIQRLPMMHRAGWTGPRNKSAMGFAWCIWDRNHRGAPKVKRIGFTKCKVVASHFNQCYNLAARRPGLPTSFAPIAAHGAWPARSTFR
jgi:hypothetical protein